MQAVNFKDITANFSRLIDKVSDDHEPLIVTGENQKAVVIMSLEDFNAWQETEYLTRSPANARDLLQAVEEINQRKNLLRKELIEE
ncbi:MAG: type II toxin-antitoxin system prevent-host-death family antitoxin [Thiotrichaceae bacterium]